MNVHRTVEQNSGSQVNYIPCAGLAAAAAASSIYAADASTPTNKDDIKTTRRARGKHWQWKNTK